MKFSFKKLLFPALILIIVSGFYYRFVFFGNVLIPSDTIVGLYHPFRDAQLAQYKNNLPYKNFLITDPVRQQYPWKHYSIEQLKLGVFPLWNPYSFSGTPLFATLQAGVLYPFNALFFMMSFLDSWGWFLFLQTFLSIWFMYLYLNSLGVTKFSAFIGGVVWAFSGFSVAWMAWGNIGHTALWLPFLLFSLERFYISKRKWLWGMALVFGIISSIFAGHTQTNFYLLSIFVIYSIVRSFNSRRLVKPTLIVLGLVGLSIGIAAVQLVPFFEFVSRSARQTDLGSVFRTDWYLPWRHLAQFIAPDYFGNPATGNYWGAWNYGEFVGYVGILPLLFAFYALFYRRDRKTWFWGSVLVLSLIFALPNFISFLPYTLKVPFISSSAPSRILFLTDFALAVCCSLGLDHFLRAPRRHVAAVFIVVGLMLIALWTVSLWGVRILDDSNYLVSIKNLVLPTIFFVASFGAFAFYLFSKRRFIFFVLVFVITVFDLFRFGWKFLPFSDRRTVFPETATTRFLESRDEPVRLATTDRRLMPPNFSVMYSLYDVSGYDPLYLSRYGELIGALKRNSPDASAFAFNRIVTFDGFSERAFDVLSVNYVLSMSDIENPSYQKVFEEGETRVYRNLSALPRVFMTGNVLGVNSKDESIQRLFKRNLGSKEAIVEGYSPSSQLGDGTVSVKKDEGSRVTFSTESFTPSFLVFLDTFDEGWTALVDGDPVRVYPVNYAFKGIEVPKGAHTVVFAYRPSGFVYGTWISLFSIALFVGVFGVWIWRLK